MLILPNNIQERLKEKHEVLPYIYTIQEKLKDNLCIEDMGLTVYKKGKKDLSLGCRACKEGTWLCIFSGYHCNLSCTYCPQNNKEMQDHPKSFIDLWTEDVKRYVGLFGGEYIKGVSYSGGEPFMYLDKILPVASFILKTKPSVYQWIYTNGILVTEDNMKKLKDSGLSEIRFHISASDFSEEVINKIKLAFNIFSRVTVEVPTVYKVKDYFLNKDGLQIIEDCGVTQLNLAEAHITERAKNFIKEERYLYNTHYNRTESLINSRIWTYDILKKAIENKSGLTINDCSNDTKWLQILKKSMNPVLKTINN